MRHYLTVFNCTEGVIREISPLDPITLPGLTGMTARAPSSERLGHQQRSHLVRNWSVKTARANY